MPTLLVRSGRNPTEACISLGILFLLAYSLLDGSAPSEVVSSGLTIAPAQWLWASLCALGAVLTLAGLWMQWRRPVKPLMGLGVERSGQFAQSLGIGSYVLLLWSESSFSVSGFVIVIGSALSIGAFGRVIQIERGMRRISRGDS